MWSGKKELVHPRKHWRGESLQKGVVEDVLRSDDGTMTKRQLFAPPTPWLWPPLSDINPHLCQDIFLSCPRMMSSKNQTTVNMVLVVTNETKLAFIPDESFYPSQWRDQREKGFNKERINLGLFKCNTGSNAKLECLKRRTATYTLLERELGEGRTLLTKQYQHGDSITLKKVMGKHWRNNS